jgi:DNA-binding XRE family transcriptional regulator
MVMRGAVESDLGFSEGGTGRARGSGNGRSNALDPEMVSRVEALAHRVRDHRQEFACSQQEFAKESGISRATLSKIEQGHIYPSMRIRRKLAKALGVGPQELWNARPEDLEDRSQQSRKQAS